MHNGRIAVLHFSNECARGGVEEHILTLLKGIDRARFRPYMVCPPPLVDKLGLDLPADVTVVPLHFKGLLDIRASLRFARVLRRYSVGIVHSHGAYASLLASSIGRACGVPVIVETSHAREQWRRGWLKSSYLVDRLVGRCVDQYIAVSEANVRYLVDQKRLPPAKIAVVRNGCDIARFDFDETARRALRGELRFNEEDPVLVVIARLEPQKGHRFLLDALPRVRTEFPHVRLVCVGDGSLRGELEAKSREMGLGSAVRFVGWQSDVASWLALSDLSVLPSLYEGLPIAAIESLAAGKPVVASGVDGIPEVVLHEQTGLIVPPADAAALGEAICRVLRVPSWRRTLGAAGRKLVAREFSSERQVRQTEELYLRSWRQSGRDVLLPAVPRTSARGAR